MEIRVWTDGETQATLTLGDCIEVMATLEPGSIHAIVTDPPYGLEFMGKAWDDMGHGNAQQAWHARWLAEAYRLLKPGGYIVAFGGTRTYHRLVCSAEDAGFEIRDSLHWMYGSGFPKSHNVSIAIDKQVGGMGHRGKAIVVAGDGGPQVGLVNPKGAERHVPRTPEAEAWDGWGTALKPAHEPIMLARKPLIGTVAKNVLAHGTGALHIDACRVETDDNLNGGAYSAGASERHDGAENWRMKRGKQGNAGEYKPPSGRWPPNILLTHSAACLPPVPGAPHACTPDCPVAALDAQNEGASRFFPPLDWDPVHDVAPFMYSAKTAKKEREHGRPEDCTDKRWNKHPTVKPVALMAWLLKLVGSAPGARVLDPFAGSGTTLCAGLLHGIETIGIEREAAYVEIARRRMAAWSELGE